MRRDPAIHIKLSDLTQVIEDLNYKEMSPKKLAVLILKNAKKHQLTDRYIQLLDLKSKGRKKAKRQVHEATDDIVGTFNLALYTERRKINPHGRIRTITRKSRQYNTLRDVALLAEEFVTHFSIPNRLEGYLEFCNIGLSMMRKYSLNRFKTYEVRIFEYFESYIKMGEDDDQEGTLKLFEYWKACLEEYAGVTESESAISDPNTYCNFLLARKQADEMGADYQKWVIAQFEGLAFLDVIPETVQLVGENAYARYLKFTNSLLSHTDIEDSVVNMYEDGNEKE